MAEPLHCLPPPVINHWVRASERGLSLAEDDCEAETTTRRLTDEDCLMMALIAAAAAK